MRQITAVEDSLSEDMVENSASGMFMLRSSGSLVLLILCCSILPSTALTTGLADQGHLVGLKSLCSFYKPNLTGGRRAYKP